MKYKLLTINMLSGIWPGGGKKLQISIDISAAEVKLATCSIACHFRDMVNPQVNLVQ
jgi:hypothetical protein